MPETSQGARLALRIATHPLTWVGVFVLVTQILRERWYPFSHFPMYSDFTPKEDYIFLQDAEGRALPMPSLIGGMTASKVNKMFHNRLMEVLKKRYKGKGMKIADVPESLEREVAGEILDKVHRLAKNSGTPLPEKTAFVHVWIIREDGKFVRHPRVLAVQ